MPDDNLNIFKKLSVNWYIDRPDKLVFGVCLSFADAVLSVEELKCVAIRYSTFLSK